MTLSELVPSLALCQQLKAAGFPQDTAMVWVSPSSGWQKDGTFQEQPAIVEILRVDCMSGLVICAAPTAGELEEWLRAKYPDADLVCQPLRPEALWMNARQRRVYESQPHKADTKWLLIKEGVPLCNSGFASESLAALAALVLEVAG